MTPPTLDPERSSQEKWGLVITNLVKLGGLVVAVNETLVEPAIRPGGLAIAALMISGGLGLETFLASLFGTKK